MSENSIVKELRYDADEGALRYKGIRYLLIRPETLADLQKTMEQNPAGQERNALYEGGYTGGYLSSTKYRDIFGFTDHEILDFMARMGREIGWGRQEIEKYDADNGILEISVASSPFAEAYGESSIPVCHLICGIVAGMGSVLFGKRCRSVETACSAMGAEKCRFTLSVLE